MTAEAGCIAAALPLHRFPWDDAASPTTVSDSTPDVPQSLAICCRGLVKRYGATEAVRGLDLSVNRGECFGLLGPNGAGKTTTIEILEGLSEPTSGEVSVLGLSWRSDEAKLRARLGV